MNRNTDKSRDRTGVTSESRTATGVLELRGLVKTYGGKNASYPALRGLDLRVEAGEFIGIMGPSGSGKTTLLNLIATIDRPSAGKVLLDGTDLGALDENAKARFRATRLGFVFQDHQLLDSLSAEENIVLPLALSRLPSGDQKNRVRVVARKLGIADILAKRPYELSGGQKQRVAAARALVVRPALILADEPTGSLDSRSANELLLALRELNASEGVGIFLVTHDAFAASHCSRVVFIKDGTYFAEIRRAGERAAFFNQILDVLRRLEGGSDAKL